MDTKMKNNNKRSHIRRMLAATALVLLGGCAAPSLNTEGEASFDGLYPVQHTVFDRVWARPDYDFSHYQQLMLQSAGIKYREVKDVSTSYALRRGEDEFPISQDARERLKEELREGFAAELEKIEGYAFTETPGPDVMIVRAGLVDVVSHVPPDVPGRSDIYLSSVGEGVLVFELLDSESEQVFVRALDKRAAASMGPALRSSVPANSAEVKRLAREWGRLLTDGLEKMQTGFE